MGGAKAESSRASLGCPGVRDEGLNHGMLKQEAGKEKLQGTFWKTLPQNSLPQKAGGDAQLVGQRGPAPACIFFGLPNEG